MPRPILRNRHSSSRLWDTVVNRIAGNSLVRHNTRNRLYRSAGIDVQKAAIRSWAYFYGPDVSIGDDSMINTHCYIENRWRIEIGKRCYLGMQVTLCTSSHLVGGPEMRAGQIAGKPIRICDGCWIGTRDTILPGVTLGPGCVIAAGAVVTKDCEPDGLYAGVPAQRKKDLPA